MEAGYYLKICGLRRGRAAAAFSLLAASAVLLLLACGVSPAQAYRFEVPNMAAHVRVNTDSSIDIWYRVEFKNTSSTQPIDVVDIGMPAANYEQSACSATINDQGLTDIRPSTVVSPGVEVHLGDKAIQPGATGVFQFHGKNPQMVYRDTEHQGYASCVFKTTWWDGDYVSGGTNLSMTMQFPPGVQPNETVYHDEKFTSTSTVEGCIAFTWVRSDAWAGRGYKYGVSFPAAYVSGVYPRQPLPDYKPVSHSTYGYKSGFNWAIYSRFFITIGAFVIAMIVRLIFSSRRVKAKGAKIQYVAPVVGMEGAGPMKELSPAEAAVLLCQDLDRVTAIAYFELIKNCLVSLQSVEPLSLARSVAVPEGAPGYYGDFMGAIGEQGTIEPEALRSALTALIRSVEARIRGFSHAETVAYYKNRAKEAWAAVKSNVDHARRIATFDEKFGELLLHQGFGSQMREAFSAGDFPVPAWALSITRSSADKGVPLAADTGEIVMDGGSLSDSIVGGFRSIQDAVLADTEDFEDDIVKEVNPREYRRVWRPVHHYGFGGGGGGCACACACAGCACACAGGGR